MGQSPHKSHRVVREQFVPIPLFVNGKEVRDILTIFESVILDATAIANLVVNFGLDILRPSDDFACLDVNV